MGDIADLENRVSAALDRIAQGIGQLGATGAQSDPVEAATDDNTQVMNAQAERIAELEAALSAEKSEQSALRDQLEAANQRAKDSVPASADNADLDALRKAHAEELEYMRAVSASEREAWEGLNSRLVRLRRTNKQMRSSAAAMRKSVSEKVADPEAINQSLQAELEALQATQELERSETDVILKTLQPLLGDPKTAMQSGGTN